MFLFGPPNIEKLEARRNVEKLIEALRYKKDSNVCRAAARALGNIGDARAVEPLIALLRDRDRDVCKAAAEALEKIGEPAVEPLVAALKDPWGPVRQHAAELLGKIGVNVKICRMCGKIDNSQISGDVVLGRPETFNNMVGKCQKCGVFVCGACANPEFKLYVQAEYVLEARTYVASEVSRGRDVGEIMDEVHRRFEGAELAVFYRCPRCGGQIGPP